MFDRIRAAGKSILSKVGFGGSPEEAQGSLTDEAKGLAHDRVVYDDLEPPVEPETPLVTALQRAFAPNRKQRRAYHNGNRIRCTRNPNFHMKRGGVMLKGVVQNAKRVHEGVSAKEFHIPQVGGI